MADITPEIDIAYHRETPEGPPIVMFSQLLGAIPALELPELSLSQKAALPAFIAYTAELDRLVKTNPSRQHGLEGMAMTKVRNVTQARDPKLMAGTHEDIGALREHVEAALMRIKSLPDKKISEFAQLGNSFRINLERRQKASETFRAFEGR